MSKLKIYGIPASRTYRTLWCVKELGLDYELIPTAWSDGGTRSPDYLAINPNGHVPAIDDDGVILWESMAINLYLAKKHGKGLWPDGIENEGRAFQWSFWVMTEVEKSLLAVLFQRVIAPEDKRDEALAQAEEEKLQGPFKVLDDALTKTKFLAGGRFTVADLNVAAVMGWAKGSRIDLSPWPALSAWLNNCLTRPAAARD